MNKGKRTKKKSIYISLQHKKDTEAFIMTGICIVLTTARERNRFLEKSANDNY